MRTVAQAIALPIRILLVGFVFLTFWGWFVVPTFDLPTLTLPAAIGIALAVQFITKHTPLTSEERTDKEFWEDWAARTFFIPAFALGIGWVVHLFM